jgi:hypothetical protein
MAEPAFIVEGHLEQKMVQLVCRQHKVVLLGVNGDNVSMATIASRIETHVKLFSNRYYPIIVIFDRERRVETVPELLTQLNEIFGTKGLDMEQFRFLISDRDIEVMFVAHVEKNGDFIETGCPQTTDIDGLHGESELRARLSKKGIRYHKTTTGIELFKKVRPTIVSFKSRNFRRFRSQMLQYCKWIAI